MIFPSNPTVGQEVTILSKTWVWNGTGWQLKVIVNITGNAGTATKLATSRTLSFTGAATGSGSFDGSANAEFSLTLAELDWSKITSGKPTTLAGYGITDAQPSDADLTAIAALAGTSGLLKKTAANTWALDTTAYQTTLVSGTNIKTINGTPVLGSGDITISGGSAIASTDELAEGVTNLYFTDARAQAAATLVCAPLQSPSFIGDVTLSDGTAYGIPVLDTSKKLKTSSVLSFNTNTLIITPAIENSPVRLRLNNSGGAAIIGVDDSYGSNFGAAYSLAFRNQANAPLIWLLNATEQMRLTSTGLGIGTSAPAYKLDVNGTGRVGAATFSATSGVGVGATLTSWGSDFRAVQFGAAGSLYSGFTDTGVRITTNIYNDGSFNRFIITGARALSYEMLPLTGKHVWRMTGSTGNAGASATLADLMVLSEKSVLGIGVSPSQNWNNAMGALQVKGGAFYSVSTSDAIAGQNLYYSAGVSKYVNAGAASMYVQTSGDHKWYSAASGAVDATVSFKQAMTLNAAGDLGLGTPTPSAGGEGITTAEIYGSNTARLLLSSTAGSVTKFGIYASGGIFGVYDYTLAIDRMRIDADGNMLLGRTAQPSGGTGRIALSYAGSASWGAALQDTSGVATAYPLVFLNSAGAVVGSIAHTSTTTSLNTTSDYRLKCIEGPVEDSGAYIDALKPVQGTWKADGSVFIGFLAHEAQAASRTQVATGSKDGKAMQSLNYASAEWVANVTAEMQSLRRRVAELEQTKEV